MEVDAESHPVLPDTAGKIEWADFKKPTAVDTGHKNKKGENIYYTIRHDKEGNTKKSFFALRDGPKKVYISHASLVKNNMGFLTGSYK